MIKCPNLSLGSFHDSIFKEDIAYYITHSKASTSDGKEFKPFSFQSYLNFFLFIRVWSDKLTHSR